MPAIQLAEITTATAAIQSRRLADARRAHRETAPDSLAMRRAGSVRAARLTDADVMATVRATLARSAQTARLSDCERDALAGMIAESALRRLGERGPDGERYVPADRLSGRWIGWRATSALRSERVAQSILDVADAEAARLDAESPDAARDAEPRGLLAAAVAAADPDYWHPADPDAGQYAADVAPDLAELAGASERDCERLALAAILRSGGTAAAELAGCSLNAFNVSLNRARKALAAVGPDAIRECARRSGADRLRPTMPERDVPMLSADQRAALGAVDAAVGALRGSDAPTAIYSAGARIGRRRRALRSHLAARAQGWRRAADRPRVPAPAELAFRWEVNPPKPDPDPRIAARESLARKRAAAAARLPWRLNPANPDCEC